MPVAPSPGKIPRRLTKQQFYAKNPKGIYQNYLNAYTRQHGGPHGPTARGRPNQPFAGPSYESLLRGIVIETPAQLQKRANQMAQAGIRAQQQIIREEAARMRDEARVRMESMAAAGRAAAAQNAGLFGMVGGEYNSAAGEIAGLGTNLSNQMVNTTEGIQLAQNAGLASVGAPEMAVGGPAGTNSIAGAPQGAVSAYQFGNLPAQAITSAGAASQFGLAGMVAAQNLRATQEGLAGYTTSVRDADRDRVAALKELAAGRPQQVAEFLSQLMEANANARDQAMALLAARQTFGLQNQQNKRATAAARQDRRTAIQNRKIANKQAALLGREISIDLSRAKGYYVDRMGRPITDKQGNTIKFKEEPNSSSATGGGWTSIAAKRDAMAKSMEYFLQDSYDKRGRLIRTKQQAIAHMKARFPGTPDAVIRQFVNASWPKSAKKAGTTGSTGGGFGSQP